MKRPDLMTDELFMQALVFELMRRGITQIKVPRSFRADAPHQVMLQCSLDFDTDAMVVDMEWLGPLPADEVGDERFFTLLQEHVELLETVRKLKKDYCIPEETSDGDQRT